LTDFSQCETHFEQQVAELCTWCKNNFLELNVKKTKEMVIASGSQDISVNELVIGGEAVERVSEYKYLGTVIDKKMNFDANTAAIVKRCNQRMFCMYRLRSFQVSQETLQIFYRSFIESVLTFSFLCWFGTLSVTNKSKLNRIVNRGSKVVCERQAGVNELYEGRLVKKGFQIMNDSGHTLSQYYQRLPSGRRLRAFSAKKVKTLNSFVPMSIRLINKLK